jgi:hypothetical protein
VIRCHDLVKDASDWKEGKGGIEDAGSKPLYFTYKTYLSAPPELAGAKIVVVVSVFDR